MSSDDEDYKLAVANSLRYTDADVARNITAVSSEPIDLVSDTDDDDDDEDLKRAIALSLQGDSNDNHVQPLKESTAIPTPVKSGLSSMGMDRKAMEEERLARLGKRKRESSPERPSKQASKTIPPPASSTDTTLQYPMGTIKRTFATKYPRTDDTTIDEVLEADTVRTAVISSFMWDSEWLFKKLDPVKTKQLWIMNAKGKDIQQRWQKEMEAMGVPNLKIHFPPMDGMIQSMHSKLMLLFGPKKLRIVIPTANMIQTDWGEVANDWQPGVMENSIFLIDLPRRGNETTSTKENMTRFGQELMYFLEMQKVPEMVLQGILNFDFSQTSHLAFVHSIGGSHKTESEHPTGLLGLTRAIQDLHLDNVEQMELDYAASSLGAINDSFLSRLYLAACGRCFAADTAMVPDVRNHIRIYFPTNETVKKSIGGPDCGGIISLSQQRYNAATFPRECLRDYESLRAGMLSHNKLLLARGRKKDGRPVGWVYVGSANLSESAWGGQKVIKDGKMGSLNIRNWECGVVMTVPDDRLAGLDKDKDKTVPMSVFEGTVEIPFRTPGDEYGARQPWFFRPG
ncbi:hypothetical protein COCSADRAFT_41609 [Bipolaris sorokiniana ND90Pr]|uniref:PLD phosphodiesterase domain-containing protein n=1 Tax=Cochliobolus sativus (strain ND90Pr / ATCC 201652) TaxID=665912 RepID=M2QVC1_COCSN|nr:uncharacterized protein COCSADRAFT_41609 [Bipolaris sorokiniana ND90Pr]EMD59064.1 hypothetical protein COCSADRAFT_41609 [Bipolaris sorokiniana ND90Pr]